MYAMTLIILKRAAFTHIFHIRQRLTEALAVQQASG